MMTFAMEVATVQILPLVTYGMFTIFVINLPDIFYSLVKSEKLIFYKKNFKGSTMKKWGSKRHLEGRSAPILDFFIPKSLGFIY